MNMEGLDEEKVEFLALLNTAQALKKVADNANPSQAKLIHRQYQTLRDRLISVDSNARNFLPRIKSSSLSTDELLTDTKVAIDQMVTYYTSMAIPIYLELVEGLKESGMIRFEEPFSKLSPILGRLGLSSKWAIAASTLCLLEVLVNRILENQKMSTDGRFEDRVSRLSSKARERGIEIPDLLAPAFYRVRHKIIHGGKEPTSEELNTIFQFLNMFFQKASALT